MWNNKWADVFDFTPVKSGDENHFELKHERFETKSLLPHLS